MRKLPKSLRTYFIILYIITIATLLISINTKHISAGIINVTFKDIIFFSFLTTITESFTLHFKNISFSTTFAITIASYVLFGPLACTIVLLIGYSLRVLKMGNGTYKHFFNTPFYGTLFNYCVLILPIYFGNYVYLVTGASTGTREVFYNILQLILFGSVYFFLNTFLISIIQGISTGKNIAYCLFSNIRLMILNILAMIPLGAIIANIFMQYHYIGVSIALFPILLLRYTFTLYADAKSQYAQTVDALMHAIEARDKYTEGHSQRVAEIANEIAKKLKYNQWKLEQFNMAAMLHDVGKIGINDAILNKPGKLTEEEYLSIKNHPEIGYNILKDIKNLESILTIVRNHHERYDGKGYPDGKAGDEVSMDTYIIQLADSVDAMSTDRPYRKALTKEQIINEIEVNSGTQFHPKVAEIYLDILKNKN